MRYLLIIPLLALLACESERTTAPTSDWEIPDAPMAAVYPRLYPDAPMCPSGTNGAFVVRIHSYFAAAPASVTWTPSHTGEERRLQAEVYSYTPTWQVCWNHWDGVSWSIVDAPSPPLVTAFDLDYSHYRIEQFRHKPGTFNGLDRIILCVSPRQKAFEPPVAGCAADTILVSMSGF